MKKIFNHVTYPLSDLDRQMVEAIPPGGNWKDIPLSVPSKRLDGIRKTGGRTTLYGRLLWHKPSYTITTYFNRPGNGAYIHPEEHRCISVREAARLQSFPDSYIFKGSKSSQTTQIGNAVPPLFAYKLAESIAAAFGRGTTLDLFCGSGGLTLGFKHAGFTTIAANDNFSAACETYRFNNPEVALIEGDITLPPIRAALFEAIKNTSIDIVMGGPPCQGFSYAGKRMIDDPRNFLYKEFVSVVASVNPSLVVFENVEGILTSNKGQTILDIIEDFAAIGYTIHAKKLHTVHYGVPQKRKRVILLGVKKDLALDPEALFPKEDTLDETSQVTVREALGDLPPLEAGASELELPLHKKATTPYQKLMRGELTLAAYLKKTTRAK